MRTRGRSWAGPFWSFVGLLVAYYAFPVRWDDSVSVIGASLVATFGGLSLLAWMMVNELEHLRRGEAGMSTQALALVLELLVMSFALSFFLLELASPGQVEDLTTRTDALYFTLSTMATVGYGDVHAAGQVARALVCAVIVFDVVVVASLLRVHTAQRAGKG